MQPKTRFFAVILISILFCIMFYHERLGLNVLLFEVLLLVLLALNRQLNLKTTLSRIALLSLLLSAFAVVLNNSSLSVVVNILALLFFSGVNIFPSIRSVLNAVGLGLLNISKAQAAFFNSGGETKNLRRRIIALRIFIIPVVVILFFLGMYRLGNPIFENVTNEAGNWFDECIEAFFKHLDIFLVVIFFIGLFITNSIMFRVPSDKLIEQDTLSKEIIERKREKRFHRNMIYLRYEYKTGIFLMIVLNLMIGLFNFLDIRFLWFGFSWEGLAFAEFVHRGVFILLISILISIGLVLFYFRRNLNFYNRNTPLKYLATFWLFQNVVLLFSVVMRNYWYVHYYSLAYKRIGVFIFLAIVLIGLITVFIKIWKKKSAFYLFRVNSLSVVVVMVSAAMFNWDVIIANYNFRPNSKSFVYLDFMSRLSDKALPMIDKSEAELQAMDIRQLEFFSFREKYMTIPLYLSTVQYRKQEFIRRWEKNSFWSWNLAEDRAYRKLTGKSQ